MSQILKLDYSCTSVETMLIGKKKKNMKNILDLEKFLLLESKEDKTKRMLRSKGYDNPSEIINAVKHDFSELEHSERPAYKFLYAICRMYVDKELQNANDISTMNSMLKIISEEPHLSEYDHNLNGLSKDEIFQRFLPIQKKETEDEINFVKRMKFTGESDYEIVKIDSYQDASRYKKYTSWCVTQNNSHFESYSCDGINQFYFCLKKGFENVKKDNKDAPLNEYGLSMISVCVDYNGMPLYVTTRYNHEFDGENNENLCSPRQVSEVINMNFFEVFKPSKKGEKFNKYKIQEKLENGADIKSLFDKVNKITNDFYLVVNDEKQSFIYKKKLVSDWGDYKFNTKKIKFIEEKNDKPVIDYDGDVILNDKKMSSIPIYFNKVGRDFYCNNNKLTSLEGGPREVGRDFYCSNNKLTSLEGGPREVGGHFICIYNNLTSLEGGPEKVGENFDCAFNKLTSLEGAPREVGGNFGCYNNELTTLEGAPREVGGKFSCYNNELTTLEGSPREVGGDFIFGSSSSIYNNLTSLEGGPEKVGGDFYCSNNNLTSLEGAPREVGRNFYCSSNKLTSLEGAPEKVGGNFVCAFNKLTSLEGAPREVGGKFGCYNNELTTLEGSPREVGGDFGCSSNKLTTLKGAPEKVGGDFDCAYNNLTSLEGAPREVGRKFSCAHNNLTSLEGAPREVGGDFDCAYNNLTSLEGAPREVGGNFGCIGNNLTSLEGGPEKIRGKIINN